MANGFAGVTNFIFPNTVSVTPGTTYYFEAVNQAGDSFLAAAGEYFYEGGYAYYNGVLNGGGDLWFREGIIVPAPEPGTLWLGVLGAGLLWAVRRKRKVEN